jgi:hypothetical protein
MASYHGNVFRMEAEIRRCEQRVIYMQDKITELMAAVAERPATPTLVTPGASGTHIDMPPVPSRVEPLAEPLSADDSFVKFVNSTPVKQIRNRDDLVAPISIASDTPSRYAKRLGHIQTLSSQLQQNSNDQYSLNTLLRELSSFVNEFQSVYVDIAKMKRHVETIKDREIDLASSELSLLQQQYEDIILARHASEQELVEKTQKYESDIQELRKQVEVNRDREIDLATSELSELLEQWGLCFQSQDVWLQTLARQTESLKEVSGKLADKEEANRNLAVQVDSLTDLV